MIVTLKKGAGDEQMNEYISGWKERGFDVHVSKGQNVTILGLVGDTTSLDPEQLRANPLVENVQRVSAPYKLANRSFHPENSVITVGGGQQGIDASSFGADVVGVIAGPCSVDVSLFISRTWR